MRDDQEMLVVSIGRLSEYYEVIIRILENMAGVDLLCAKEILRREWETMKKKGSSEVALRATKEKFQRKSSKLIRGRMITFLEGSVSIVASTDI